MTTFTYWPDSKSSLDVELLGVYNSIVEDVREEDDSCALPVVFGVTVEGYDSEKYFCKADIAVNVDTGKYDDLETAGEKSIRDVARSITGSIYHASEPIPFTDIDDLDSLDETWCKYTGEHLIGKEWSVSYK